MATPARRSFVGAGDVAEDAAETVGGKAASEATESAGDEAGAGACSIHSFTGDTPVLMADGSSQPIDTLKVGDQVADSKPDGHGTQKHRVDRVIVTHTDHDFVDLTITTKAGVISVWWTDGSRVSVLREVRDGFESAPVYCGVQGRGGGIGG